MAVAFYGDSLTEAPGYASFLAGDFVPIVRGLSGELGTQGSVRFRADLGERLVAVEEADAAVLMWGANDVRSLDYDEADLVASLTRAVDEAVRRGLPVVMALPPDFQGELHSITNQRLDSYRRALAARLAESFEPADVRVVDLTPRFAGHADPASLYSDGVHWSEAGQAVAAAAVASELRGLGIEARGTP